VPKEQCRWVLDAEPDFVTAHYRAGLAYEQLGEYVEAVNAFQSAIALSADGSKAEAMAPFKGGSDARASIAHTYALMGKREAARSVLAELEQRARHASTADGRRRDITSRTAITTSDAIQTFPIHSPGPGGSHSSIPRVTPTREIPPA
jgi:tetratricopeptide (TPR) repeat protein